MNDPRQWLDAAQERANAATEGPWEHQPWGGQNQNGDYAGGEVFADGEYLVHDVSDADGAFIAGARTEHPAMVAALTAVLDLIDNDSWVESAEFGLVNVVNADDIREAITDHLKDTK